VALGQPLLNAGSATAAGLSGTLTGGSGVTITQASSAYPDLGQDAVATNTSAFGAQLAADAGCGAAATLALGVQSTTGTQTLPIAVPTGTAGPVSGTSTAVTNGAIGDDDITGVSSSVLVTQGGRIKDLDVTLGTGAEPGIAHSFVGDLVIELTGPDGTTVRLAEHPGGPDNGGDNLAGTTFDDEAAQAIGDAGTAAPYTGSFRPQGDRLSRFDGKSWQGLWTLRVRDLFADDTGTLRSWGTAGQQAICDFVPPVGPPPPPATPATSFVLAPAEEDPDDARAGRLTVLAACSSACRASATLSVPPRTARKLGLGRKSVVLGRGAQRRGSGGTAKVAVRLSKRARAALRGRRVVGGTLRATIEEGGKLLGLSRAISLRRSAGLARIASRGLRLWAVCERSCPLRAQLTLSAAEARRLGLRRRGSARYEAAAGRITAGRTPRVLKLTVRRAARRPLARARRVGALLEAVAGTTPEPLRTARLSKTLRR
jgi:subtilisin-like proprotein convertase family protein